MSLLTDLVIKETLTSVEREQLARELERLRVLASRGLGTEPVNVYQGGNPSYVRLGGETENVLLWSGSDFIVYSDTGSTEKARIDGATGNITTAGTVDGVDVAGANAAQYVTLAVHANIANERVLTGTANQVVVTDGGAGVTVTLSTPQDIHTGASPTFAGLDLADGNITNVGQIDLDLIRADAADGSVTIELDDAAGADLLVGNNSALVVEGDDDFVGMGTADPQRRLHVVTSASGAITLVGLHNPDTTDDNAAVVSFRSDTTGAGATAFTEFAGIKGKFTTHDHATRAGEFIMFNTVGGATADRLIIGSDIALTPVDGVGIALGNDAGDDFVIDTTSFVVEGDTGKAGFGTAVPDQLVHLSANTSATLRIESTDTAIQAGEEYGVIEFESRDNSAQGIGARIAAICTSTAARMELGFETGVAGSASEAVRIDYLGKVGVGITASLLGKTHIDQSSSTGAIPVLFLDQGDVSEQCIQFSSDATDRDIHLFTVNVTGAPKMWWDESADAFALTKGIAIGDGGTTNYATFAADGELTLVGTARVVKDIWLDAGAIRAPGAKPASQVAHGALETVAWQFGDEIEANEETISLNIKFPNDMDKSVGPLMCVGWSTTTLDPGDDSEQVEWQLEYLYTQLDEATNAAAEETLYVTSSASTTAEGLVVSTFTGMNTPHAADVCVHCRIKRLSAAAAGSGDDTVADDVEVHGVVMQYTSDQLGTAT